MALASSEGLFAIDVQQLLYNKQMGSFCGIEDSSSCGLLIICISFMCIFSVF